ncbi:MAG: S1 RNA-binding domain-containing protein, partial [Vulcanimicrobiota bacterium]
MSLEIGTLVEGEITGIANFGAFVKLEDNESGLIHISEVADAYVKDINEYLKVGDKVTVKVLGVNEKGKYDLSLKQAAPPAEKKEPVVEEEPPVEYVPAWTKKDTKKGKSSFEDKLSRFLKESEERQLA